MSSKYQFKLPDVGEGMAEGTVGEWHVAVGDQVEKDQDFVQIENDKSVEELPSPVAGTVTPAAEPAPMAVPTAPEGWPEHAEKMSPVRKATAKAMTTASHEIPMITVFDEVVVDKLWDHLKKYK